MVGQQERVGRVEALAQTPSDGARWTAALGYVAFMCLFTLGRAKRDPFVRFHASQGFLLFVAECLSVLCAVVLALTLGRIRLAGFVAVVLFELVAVLGALSLSIAGVATALRGEYWSMPFLGDLRGRVPGLDWRRA